LQLWLPLPVTSYNLAICGTLWVPKQRKCATFCAEMITFAAMALICHFKRHCWKVMTITAPITAKFGSLHLSLSQSGRPVAHFIVYICPLDPYCCYCATLQLCRQSQAHLCSAQHPSLPRHARSDLRPEGLPSASQQCRRYNPVQMYL